MCLGVTRRIQRISLFALTFGTALSRDRQQRRCDAIEADFAKNFGSGLDDGLAF